MKNSPSNPRPAVAVRFESYTPEPRISHKKHPVLLSVLVLAAAFAAGRYTKGDSEDVVRKQEENAASVQKRIEFRKCVTDLLDEARRKGSSVSMQYLNDNHSRCESIVLAKPDKKTERD
jgi:hypothetical protein